MPFKKDGIFKVIQMVGRYYVQYFNYTYQRTIEEIREFTNKSWVLGSEYFKEKIEDKVNRPMSPRTRGGDRKSKTYQKSIKKS